MSRLSVSRRRFLAAAGASALTLPFLRALPSYAGGDKQYLILLFSPVGVVRYLWGSSLPAGTAPSATSAVATPNFTLLPWLQPLATYQPKMVVVRGLCNKAAGIGDPHGPGMASLWTGMDVANQNAGPMGPSIDQTIAAMLKAPTPYPSIAFRATSPQDYEGVSIYNRMIYDAMGNAVDPYDNPVATLSELFLGIGGGADAGAADAGPDPQVALRQQVLTHLNGELGRVMPKLCNEDRAQLDAFQSGLNALNTSATMGTGALQVCGKPTVTGGATYPQIVQDTINLLVMSIACDLSRVFSLQFSQALSPMIPSFLNYNGSPLTIDHHSLSHEMPMRYALGPTAPVNSDTEHPTAAQIAQYKPVTDQMAVIDTWYASQVKALCDALSAIQVGNGKTLFDQCLICWGNELDSGSDHDHWDLPIMLLGGANGALKTGQLVEYPVFNGYGLPTTAKYNAKRAHNDLHVTLAQLMGVNLTTFGNPMYNVGPLSEIMT
jgi:hypothetical protein